MNYTLLNYFQSVLWLGLLGSFPAAAQQSALYVNDSSTAGDVYTTAPGSDLLGTGASSAPFATVAAALQAADATTATIYIDAGTYNERVTLQKNISLQGAGTATNSPGSATIFDGGLAPSGTQTAEAGLLITASGGTPGSPVLLADFTVRNYDYGVQTSGSVATAYFVLEDVEAVTNRRQGIEWNGLAGTSNITFRRIRAAQNALPPNSRNNGAGRGLFLVNGTKTTILIEDGVFEQNYRAGIDINDGSVGNLIIRGNRFFQNVGPGIAVLGAAGVRNGSGTYTTPAALLENNGIRDNASNGMELKACTGTGLASGAGSFVVRNNYIARGLGQSTALTEDNAGIAFVDRDRTVINVGGGVNSDLTTGGAFIQGNTVRGYRSTTGFNINGFGVVVEGSNNKVFNNVVAQCQRGIQAQDRPATSAVAFTPYFDIDRNQALVSSGDSIRQNRLDSCTTALRAVNLTNVVEAGLNYVGSSNFAAVRGASGTGGLVVTLGAPNGFPEQSAFGVTGRLDYSPFLNSPTDAAPMAGFQPGMLFLHVDGFSPASGPAGHLQEALPMVLEGGTINTSTATYSGTATVSKNLTLTNAGAPTTLQNLVLNGAGKTLTLGSPFSLSGNLTLTNGLIATTTANLLTLTDGATSTDGSATSYVDGPLQKVGSTAFVFPVGKGGVWARLAISAPATATAAFTAEYFATAFANTTATAPMDNASRVEYWNLNRTTGTDEVSVRLFWENGSRSGINEFSNDLQVAYYNGTAWNTNGNGGLTGNLAAGSVVSAAPASSYGLFTFGSLSPVVNPLPVELVSFQGAAGDDGVVNLSWVTASEKDNAGFGLERSPDGLTWKQVAFVAGRGTTTQRQEYAYQDVPGFGAPTLYYRLRQQDISNQSSYSQVVSVHVSATETIDVATLSPNPATATDAVTLTLPQTLTATTHVSLLDLTGRVMLRQTLSAGSTRYEIQMPNALPAGIYLLQLAGNASGHQAIRLVRQ